MNPYKQLANAIILQAIEDYDAPKEMLRISGRELLFEEDEEAKLEIERFIRSPWFACLTDIDPEWLIKQLREGDPNIRENCFGKEMAKQGVDDGL